MTFHECCARPELTSIAYNEVSAGKNLLLTQTIRDHSNNGIRFAHRKGKTLPSRHDIQSELVSAFPEVFGQKRIDEENLLKHSITEIEIFLAGSTLAQDVLKEINRRMRHVCGSKCQQVEEYYQQIEVYYDKIREKAKIRSAQEICEFELKRPIEPDSVARGDFLLTHIMEEIEKNAGFGKGAGAPVDTLLGFIEDGDSFRKIIHAGRMFNDPAASGWHGEHTHRLQWSMIALSNVTADVPFIYRFVGKFPYLKDLDRGLWDVVCDRDAGDRPFVPFKVDKALQEDNLDFRSPECLTRYICEVNNAEKFSLLHAFVRARLAKRLAGFDKTDYILRKLFPNKTYAQLSTTEKERFDRAFRTEIISIN